MKKTGTPEDREPVQIIVERDIQVSVPLSLCSHTPRAAKVLANRQNVEIFLQMEIYQYARCFAYYIRSL